MVRSTLFFKLASIVAFRQQLRPSLDKWPFSGVQNRPPGTPNLPAPKSHGPRPSRGAQSGPGLAAGRGFLGPQGGGFPEADSVPLKAIWQQYRISITYRASWLIRHRNVYQGCGICFWLVVFSVVVFWVVVSWGFVGLWRLPPPVLPGAGPDLEML